MYRVKDYYIDELPELRFDNGYVLAKSLSENFSEYVEKLLDEYATDYDHYYEPKIDDRKRAELNDFAVDLLTIIFDTLPQSGSIDIFGKTIDKV